MIEQRQHVRDAAIGRLCWVSTSNLLTNSEFTRPTPGRSPSSRPPYLPRAERRGRWSRQDLQTIGSRSSYPAYGAPVWWAPRWRIRIELQRAGSRGHDPGQDDLEHRLIRSFNAIEFDACRAISLRDPGAPAADNAVVGFRRQQRLDPGGPRATSPAPRPNRGTADTSPESWRSMSP